MSSLNKVMLIGRLGQDPEIKQTQSFVVANFSMATNESWTGKNGQKQSSVEWHDVVAWDSLAKLSGDYLKKGSRILVEGKLQTQSWEDANGCKHQKKVVVCNSMKFLDTVGSANGVNTTSSPEDGTGLSKTDELPF